MPMVRIREVRPLSGFRLRLVLTNGRVVERNVSSLLVGPIFKEIRSDFGVFAKVRVESGTVVWPDGADLCPDVLIWSGPPPARRKRENPRSHRADRGGRSGVLGSPTS